MTTPSSSTTTPSPPMAFLQAKPLAGAAPALQNDIDAAEREERQRAVQKLLARAEISKLTRGLRARLSYATYKASHNISRASIGDLESQLPADNASAVWAPVRTNYYDNPATQGNSAMNPSLGASQRKGSMAPPTVIPSSSSRGHHAQAAQAREPSSANGTQSLYATIHNPDDPPIPAPEKSSNGTPKQRKGSHASESSRHSHTRTGVAERTQEPRKRKESSKKGKGKRHVDIDMKAAATLTHLLRQRSSMTLGATSPRSSISAGSDYAQSSARTSAQTTMVPSAESSFTTARPATPPRSDLRGLPRTGSQSTDGGPASATDQEAIKLLYFLHESPSPARPSTTRSRNAQDAAAFRTLGGGNDLKAKGRVLFPTASGGPPDPGLAQRMLARDNTGSISSISSAMTDSPTPRPLVTPPTPTEEKPTGLQLLPPPPSPHVRPAQAHPAPPTSPPAIHKSQNMQPVTPGTLTFNLHDFINVSPSPAAMPQRSHGGLKPMLPGLRTGSARKLFQDEQDEPMSGPEESRVGEAGGAALGAGIHLTHF
ncbi:hypothetical protein FA95DRAFT_1580129 [Auriscalpium vulgare]|uniref:Uncharacterized protein n=1 Tax=Auriscalpium vulgare TaxID=40419 RepID=A0ACB8S8R3_9AGAM|nr:hypothetical protein FA95DRAFT_1580129 [Auriscalpium vulgare]